MENKFLKKVYSNIERPKETKYYLTNIGEVKFDLTTNSFYSKTNDCVDFAVKYWIKEIETFEESVEPAIIFLFKNHNPHTSIVIDYDIAKLVEGLKSHNLTKCVPD